MTEVLEGFATVGLVIALGAFLAHIRLVDDQARVVLARLAFFVASPALMVTTIGASDVSDVLSGNLVATAAGVLVPAAIYALVARLVWRREVGDTVIGALASSYVNAGNLGIPVAAYALGNASYVAPTLLLQLLVLQPLALAVLDADRGDRRISAKDLIVRPFTNPLTLGSLAGLALAITGWKLPFVLLHPVELVGSMAVPAMLIAYGIALRLGPGLGGGIPKGELVLTTMLKTVVQPLTAFVVAKFALGLDGHALLAVVVCSALPTAQNIYVHAARFDRATTLARDTILLTTTLAVPVIVGIAYVLG
ncbi:AEC family transporter [Demetria terragena]|uniref:AEC family transporter n=1 Tax=Demetria terragena TaxID=63959 RepID=UPI000477A8D1|nr:AEC family transporter [Demetria terragena]